MECKASLPDLEAWIDGEAPRPPHLDACGACRREADARRALRDRLRSLRLPPPRLRLSEAPKRRVSVLRLVRPIAAAALIVVLIFLASPAPSEPLPEIVRRASSFHDLLVAGDVRPDEVSRPELLSLYFRDRMKLDVVVPDLGAANVEGGCCCELPGERNAAPCIVYNVRGVPMSLLILEDEVAALPDSARRARGGQEYFVFRSGRNTVLLCRSGSVCHLWTSALDETALLDTILQTSVGRQAFSGERLTLSGVT